MPCGPPWHSPSRSSWWPRLARCGRATTRLVPRSIPSRVHTRNGRPSLKTIKEKQTMNTVETGAATLERGALAATRLVFPHGVANLNIRVDASMPQTYRGEFYGPKPRVTETDGVISIDYPRFNP